MSRFEIVLRPFLAIAVVALPGPIFVSAAETASTSRFSVETHRHAQVVVVQRSVAPASACASYRSKGPCPQISKLVVTSVAAPDALVPVLGSWMEAGFRPGSPPCSSPSVPRAPPQIGPAILLG